MREVIKIKSNAMFDMINDLLELGKSARITVSGDSMFPFLRHSLDSVELSKGSFSEVKRGDIVMMRRTDGRYVMHRVIRKEEECLYMVGDAQQWVEGPLVAEQLIAVVHSVWRKDKRIECTDLRWRIPSELWLKLLRVRKYILRIAKTV